MNMYYLVIASENGPDNSTENVLASTIKYLYEENNQVHYKVFCQKVEKYTDLDIPTDSLSAEVIYFRLFHHSRNELKKFLHSVDVNEFRVDELSQLKSNKPAFLHFRQVEMHRLYFSSIFNEYNHNRKSDIVNSPVGLLKVLFDNTDVHYSGNLKQNIESASEILKVLHDMFESQTEPTTLTNEVQYIKDLITFILVQLRDCKKIKSLKEIPDNSRINILGGLQELFDIISNSGRYGK